MTKWRLALVAGVLGFVVAYMQYNKPHKDYGAEPIERSWEADELVMWFKETPAEEHGTWQDKVVRVDGVVVLRIDGDVLVFLRVHPQVKLA